MPREPTIDRQGLLVLGREECLGLLHTSKVGRLVFVDESGPLALPVNHAVHRGQVVFLTASGSKLDAAEQADRPVAFEVDAFDAVEQAGWSVVIRGRLDSVSDPDEVAELESLGLRPWADEVDRDRWLRVRTDEISGRRIIRRPDRTAR